MPAPVRTGRQALLTLRGSSRNEANRWRACATWPSVVLGAAAGEDQRRAGRRGCRRAGVVIAVVVANDLAKCACQSCGPRDDGHPLHGMGNRGQVVVVERVDNDVAGTSGAASRSSPAIACCPRRILSANQRVSRDAVFGGHQPRQV